VYEVGNTMYKNSIHISERTRCALITKANRWRFYREILTLDDVNLTEYTNPLYGQNAELINVTKGGTYNNH